MPDDDRRFFQHPELPPSAELEFVMEQLARLPTRRELARYAVVILAIGAVLRIVATAVLRALDTMSDLELAEHLSPEPSGVLDPRTMTNSELQWCMAELERRFDFLAHWVPAYMPKHRARD
jgi:hypothetical protein